MPPSLSPVVYAFQLFVAVLSYGGKFFTVGYLLSSILNSSPCSPRCDTPALIHESLS